MHSWIVLPPPRSEGVAELDGALCRRQGILSFLAELIALKGTQNAPIEVHFLTSFLAGPEGFERKNL
jgi:hypothetical protein